MKSLPVITNCDNCGACCMHMRTPPHIAFIHADGTVEAHPGDKYGDAKRLASAPAEARRVAVAGLYDDSRPDESPCSWLDLETKKCRWYAWRPDVCRNGMKVGDAGCRAARRRMGIELRATYRMARGRLVRA